MTVTRDVPAPGRRGPHRPRAEDAVLAALLADGAQINARIAAAQAELDHLVAQRRQLIRQLHEAGLSVRAICRGLSLTTTSVQRASARRGRSPAAVAPRLLGAERTSPHLHD